MSDPDPEPPRKRSRRTVVTVVLVASAWVWLGFSHLGAFGQTLAVVAPAGFAAIVVVHVVVLARRRHALTALSLAVWLASGAVMVCAPRAPQHFGAPHDPVTLVAANLHFHNPTPERAAGDVVARHADVVVVSEATDRSATVLAAAYRFHARSEPGRAGYSEYVGSRYPLRIRAVPDVLDQALVVDVMAPQPFELVAVHLPRPGYAVPLLPGHFNFAEHRRAVHAVETVTASARLPVVVAGDLNASDRTASYHDLVAHRRDAMRARWAGATFRPFPFNLLSLRIDHVIIDHAWCAAHSQRFHPTGSDHESVAVTIGPCSSRVSRS